MELPLGQTELSFFWAGKEAVGSVGPRNKGKERRVNAGMEEVLLTSQRGVTVLRGRCEVPQLDRFWLHGQAVWMLLPCQVGPWSCTCVSVPTQDTEGKRAPSTASVLPHLLQGTCLVGQRQSPGNFFYYRETVWLRGKRREWQDILLGGFVTL